MIINQVKKINKEKFLELKKEYIDYLNQEEYHIHYLDGKIIENEQDYFNHFKDVYLFGKHFGNNWNAFVDCMIDLDFWDDKQGFVLVIYNFHKFIYQNIKDRNDFIEALKYICFYLEKECLTTSGGRNHLKSFDVYLIDEDIEI
jgi:hypothetical protein